MKLEADDRLVDVFEASTLLARKKSTIRKDIFLKKLPVVKIGRQIRIPLSAIQALITKGYRPAAK
jgi:excisionase family DNA binding protein